MRLTGQEILLSLRDGRLAVSPLRVEQIGPCSIDLRLGPEICTLDRSGGPLDSHVTPRLVPQLPVSRRGRLAFLLRPGELYLAHTEERVRLEGLAGVIFGRSTGARYGITVESAGFVDDGFDGEPVLEIQVAHYIWVYPGDRICQLALEPVLGERMPYGEQRGHHYQGQRGVRGPCTLGDGGPEEESSG